MSCPSLKPFVFQNEFKTKTIDFANPKSVKALNKALLFEYYNVKFWDFPDTNLCPPIPGRVDYIHHLADLLKASGIIETAKIVDIGTGASCIYPILGSRVYNWSFTGTDIDPKSLKSAQQIIIENGLNESIELKLQTDASCVFKGVFNTNKFFSSTMCNPPFYNSEKEALEATTRKLKGLNKLSDKILRNFSGTNNELIYKGGEKAFVHNYLYESSIYKNQCFWFTILISNKDLIKGMYVSLKKLKATEIKTINMGQGNKISRFVAWSFLTAQEQKAWNH